MRELAAIHAGDSSWPSGAVRRASQRSSAAYASWLVKTSVSPCATRAPRLRVRPWWNSSAGSRGPVPRGFAARAALPSRDPESTTTTSTSSSTCWREIASRQRTRSVPPSFTGMTTEITRAPTRSVPSSARRERHGQQREEERAEDDLDAESERRHEQRRLVCAAERSEAVLRPLESDQREPDHREEYERTTGEKPTLQRDAASEPLEQRDPARRCAPARTSARRHRAGSPARR